MKYFKYLIILIVFFKTGNVLSGDNIFNVNNIQIVKKSNISNNQHANKAIKKGFDELLNRILLDQDKSSLKNLNLSEINELVSYYQLAKIEESEKKEDIINYNIFFDKEKLHELFYDKKIFYSEIGDKELYLLPIFKKKGKYYIFTQNFFYENWNKEEQDELIEFVLPIENIEIIEKVSINQNNIIDINLNDLFREYEKKNLAFVYIEELNSNQIKVYLKTIILSKSINKSLMYQKKDTSNQNDYFEQVILNIKKEITNIIKSQNLIDVRTPSFINVKLTIDKRKNNLNELNKRFNEIDSIENIYVQELNNRYVFLKIKYLGKLNKIIEQLKNKNIILEDIGNQWSLKIR
tara:strand:- start:1081 stop:2130 length:1050 start_codon:yes stop_codon:yes gene_type:complete